MNPAAHSVSTPPAINKNLLELFELFNLEDYAARIAGALGVKVPTDFCDVDEAQMRETSENLGLKPVQHNRMMELWRTVCMIAANWRNGEWRQGARQATAIMTPQRSALRSKSPGRRRGSVRFMEGIELRYGCLEMVR